MGLPPVRQARRGRERSPRERRQWPSRRPGLLRGVALAAALLVLVAALLAAREAAALRADLRDAQDQFDRAVAVADPNVVETGSFAEADAALRQSAAHLRAADAALAQAQRRVRRLDPLLAAGALLPGWPRGLRDVPPLIASARGFAAAGLTLSDALAQTTARLDADSGSAEPVGARLAAALTTGEPGFRLALDQLEGAQATRRTVHDERLTGPLRPGRAALARLDERYSSVRDAMDLLALLPAAARSVLGMDGPRTYVVLGQNSAELRPTGGFIGSLGLVTVDQGELVAQDYRGSYTVDNPTRGFEPLPVAMATYLGSGGLAVRDANWSPDFPTTARKVEQLLAHHQDIRADGVIAFTSHAVGMVLDAVGPLPVEGIDEPLTAATWYDLADRLIYFSDPGAAADEIEANKGEVLGPILRAVLARVQGASADDLPVLLRTLRAAVAEKQVLIWFHDRPAATLVRRANADGRMAPPPGRDVLAVVDANLSHSKVGPHIRQRIEYDVWLSARGVPTASRVTVTYDNTLDPAQAADPARRIGGWEWDATRGGLFRRPGLYGTYARVYVPANSRLIDAGAGAPPLAGRELGFTTYERFERVPAGEQRSFSYTYQIPRDLMPAGVYRLRVLKQPGTEGHELVVRVHLPDGMTATPSRAMAQEGATLVYRGQLDADLSLEVALDPRAP